MLSSKSRLIARNIAAVLLAGVWAREAMTKRLLTWLGPQTRSFQRKLVLEILEAHKRAYPPSLPETTKLVASLPAFQHVARPLLRSTAALRMALKPPRFAPLVILRNVDVQPLPTFGDISDWLGLSIAELSWFCDERNQHRRSTTPELQHYIYSFRAKRLGPPRLIEAPKPRLKAIQRRILHSILNLVPIHDAAHGFVKGRSCRTGAVIHEKAAVVVCFDIADFFLTTPMGRVHAIFRTIGYPHGAARVLTRLCSTVTPDQVFDRIPAPHSCTRAALAVYRERHLPQGAPTSPALANLAAWRLDLRLTGLAASLGGSYSRYADDLTFSGDEYFAMKTNSLLMAVKEIVEDENYTLNARKTRIMSQGQRQKVTGIVVNEHANVSRQYYDQLKATLHNCRMRGLDAENLYGHSDFRAHLEGRIGWVESLNPSRGRKLREILRAIP